MGGKKLLSFRELQSEDLRVFSQLQGCDLQYPVRTGSADFSKIQLPALVRL